jgi:hypothetical protein
MLPGHTREISAAAFHLLALLERYEQDTASLLGSSWSPDVHARWANDFEQMRLVALTVGDLHVPWLHLLISRAELVHAVWQMSNGRPTQRALDELEVPHQDAITALRNRAIRLIKTESRSPS